MLELLLFSHYRIATNPVRGHRTDSDSSDSSQVEKYLGYYVLCIEVGLASVGNDTVKYAARQGGNRVLFGGRRNWRSSYSKSFVRGGEPLLRTRGMIGSPSVYGKAPTRQLHSVPIAGSGSGHTGKQINSFHAVIHMQESAPHKRFSVVCSSPFMPSCDSPNTSRRFALGASDACLPDENPMCSVSAL